MARSAKPRIRGFKSRSRLSFRSCYSGEYLCIADCMLQTISALLLRLQQFLAPKQKILIRCFVMLEIGLVVFGLTVAYLSITDPMGSSWLLGKYGTTLGKAALILFMITLIPGILQRLRWYPQLTMPIAAIITLFRRHIGITMFLTAWLHMAFTMTLPFYIFTGSFFPPAGPRLFEMAGFIGWILLLPVWLTSNDTSMRFLGRKWKTLQRLTYIAIWFIVAHVALHGGISWMSVSIVAVAALEILSWIVARRRQTTTTTPGTI